MHSYDRKYVNEEERREFLKALGVAGAVGVTGEFTLETLQAETTVSSTAELEAIGQAIRKDLSGSLQASVLSSGTAGIAEQLERIPELAAIGIPAEEGTAYQELTEPAWAINDHLLEVGFYETAEQHLEPFTATNIETTAKAVINSGSLSGLLAEAGFSAEEQTALMMNVVNNNEHLAKWMPVDMYPDEAIDDFDPKNVAAVHHRAAEGSLNWIDGLDQWLWQNGVLLTEEMVAKGLEDIKAMLGGFYLMGAASEQLARGEIADADLSALLTAGSAAMIRGQEDLTEDLVRIRESERAPQGGVN